MIPIDYVEETCKLGAGEATCAFLAMGAGGFECAKDSGLALIIEKRLAEGTMGAKGDNCPGWNQVASILN